VGKGHHHFYNAVTPCSLSCSLKKKKYSILIKDKIFCNIIFANCSTGHRWIAPSQ